MNIVHVVVTEAFAGVEQHVARLAEAQTARGDTVTVVGGESAGMTRVAPHVGHVPVRTTTQAVRAVRRLARSADVMHAHMTAAEVAMSVGLLGVRRRPPVVSTRHFAHQRGSGRLSSLVAFVAARPVCAQIAISRFVADAVEGPSVVVPPGIDTGSAPVPETTDRAPVVLVVQRLEAEKDTGTALHAFATSGLAARGWRLRLAGDGARRPALETLARDLGVARSVEFLGHRSDVDELMRHAAVMLAPCPREGLGLAVLEAMRAGLPVVASRSGGHLETVGALPDAPVFDPGDAAEASRVLRRLADDPDGRRRLSEAGLAAVGSMTPADQARATDAVYRAATPGTASSPEPTSTGVTG